MTRAGAYVSEAREKRRSVKKVEEGKKSTGGEEKKKKREKDGEKRTSSRSLRGSHGGRESRTLPEQQSDTKNGKLKELGKEEGRRNYGESEEGGRRCGARVTRGVPSSKWGKVEPVPRELLR